MIFEAPYEGLNILEESLLSACRFQERTFRSEARAEVSGGTDRTVVTETGSPIREEKRH